MCSDRRAVAPPRVPREYVATPGLTAALCGEEPALVVEVRCLDCGHVHRHGWPEDPAADFAAIGHCRGREYRITAPTTRR